MKYLIITANFAPRGASPAVRTVNFVKQLSKLGHAARVLTYDETTLTTFSEADEVLTMKVPPSVLISRIEGGWIRRLIFRQKRDSSAACGQKKRYSANPLVSLLIPDPHVDAIRKFIRAGKVLITDFNPDVVITHGYPFSMHAVGTALKRKFPNLFWVADYGDPWVSAPVSELPRPNWRKRLDYHLESRWLSRADMVSVTTVPTLELYENHFPFLKGKLFVLPMAFDPDDFKTISPIDLPKNLEDKFLIVHAGRIYPQARDPLPFIEAVKRLKEEKVEVFNRLLVVLVGENDNYVRSIIDASGAKEAFLFIPWVPVHESIAWMKAADWLLLLGNKGGIQIPGKVFQYIGARRPIIMTLLNDDDPTANIVRDIADSRVVRNEVHLLFEELMSITQIVPSVTVDMRQDEDLGYSWPAAVSSFSDEVFARHKK